MSHLTGINSLGAYLACLSQRAPLPSALLLSTRVALASSMARLPARALLAALQHATQMPSSVAACTLQQVHQLLQPRFFSAGGNRETIDFGRSEQQHSCSWRHQEAPRSSSQTQKQQQHPASIQQDSDSPPAHSTLGCGPSCSSSQRARQSRFQQSGLSPEPQASLLVTLHPITHTWPRVYLQGSRRCPKTRRPRWWARCSAALPPHMTL